MSKKQQAKRNLPSTHIRGEYEKNGALEPPTAIIAVLNATTGREYKIAVVSTEVDVYVQEIVSRYNRVDSATKALLAAVERVLPFLPLNSEIRGELERTMDDFCKGKVWDFKEGKHVIP